VKVTSQQIESSLILTVLVCGPFAATRDKCQVSIVLGKPPEIETFLTQREL